MMPVVNVLKCLDIEVSKEDMKKIQREMRNHGYKISDEGIYMIWAAHSKKHKTKWADIPGGAELWNILKDYVKR